MHACSSSAGADDGWRLTGPGSLLASPAQTISFQFDQRLSLKEIQQKHLPVSSGCYMQHARVCIMVSTEVSMIL